MTRERRILLWLLGAAALSAATASCLYAQLDRLRVMNEQTAFFRKQYLKLPADAPTEQTGLERRILELKKTESEEAGRYYAAGEMDLYRFASTVNGMLAHRGVTVQRVRTVTGATALELSARGSAAALMAFLSDVSARPKYWAVPYLHLQAPSGTGAVTCEMQIGYLSDEEGPPGENAK